MTIHFNKILKHIVLYVFLSNLSFSWAGSYEDFFQATQRDQVQVVSNLLSRGFDPNTVNVNAEPAIFDAWDHGALKVLESLIRHPNTKLNVKNSHGESLLMLVCLKGNLKFSQLLIERQADINHPGWTPLHYAATNGNTKIVKMLLDESAYIDAESPNGTTPLMMAARYGSPEAVQLLIKEGADIHLKNQLGLSALNFAKDGGRPDSIKFIEAALAQSAPQASR
jgi:ankyrin repeat protein